MTLEQTEIIRATVDGYFCRDHLTLNVNQNVSRRGEFSALGHSIALTTCAYVL